jgi:hypothetical protein
MNKKVFVSMLALCVTFLAGLYIAKIFFPQEFMMSIQNERIIKIGTYIDTHKWLYYVCCGITAFITYYLYCCASSGRIRLAWYEILEIVGVIVVIRAISFYDDTLATAIELASFLFLPYLLKGKLKNCAITYTVHTISQGLSLSIRSLPLYLHSANFITFLFMTFECYFWLILNCIIMNYQNKEEK